MFLFFCCYIHINNNNKARKGKGTKGCFSQVLYILTNTTTEGGKK